VDQGRSRQRPKLRTPCAPSDEERREFFVNNSSDVKVVSDYTALSFREVGELELFDYYGYLHDAVVWNCSRTEAGRDYLESAYNHSRTEPDRSALRAKLGGGKRGG